MSTFDPYKTGSVIVSFVCINCESEVSTKMITVPPPDRSAVNETDSNQCIVERTLCPNPACQKRYDIAISATFSGGVIKVSDADESTVSFEINNDPTEYPCQDADYEACKSFFPLRLKPSTSRK